MRGENISENPQLKQFARPCLIITSEEGKQISTLLIMGPAQVAAALGVIPSLESS